MGEREYNAGNFVGSASLMHMVLYLEDRLKYELFPPPNKMAIPVKVDGCLGVEIGE